MDQDFGGFRVVALLPRFKPGWVPPKGHEDEAPKRCAGLGAPHAPVPCLMPNGKPICAATIRAGPGFLEVPFFATQETRRRKGYGRGLLQVGSTPAPEQTPAHLDAHSRACAPGLNSNSLDAGSRVAYLPTSWGWRCAMWGACWRI